MSDFMEILEQWWLWTHVQMGAPHGYRSTLAVYRRDSPRIDDETAMRVDKLVAELVKIAPLHAAALLADLRGEAPTLAARRLPVEPENLPALRDEAVRWLQDQFSAQPEEELTSA